MTGRLATTLAGPIRWRTVRCTRYPGHTWLRRFASGGGSQGEQPSLLLPRPQLDLRAVIADPEAVVRNALARRSSGGGDGSGLAASVARIVGLHEEVQGLAAREQALRTERKQLGKAQAAAAKLTKQQQQHEQQPSSGSGGEGFGACGGAGREMMERGRRVKEELGEVGARREVLEAELAELGAALPNTTHAATPIGGEEANLLLGTSCERGGAPRRPCAPPALSSGAGAGGFVPRDHVELGSALGLFDFSAAARVSGSKFVYLTGEGALLELALVQYAMQTMAARGWSPVITPDLVRQPFVAACGFTPRGEHTQIYSIEQPPPPRGGDGGEQQQQQQQLVLNATAEAPLAGMWSGQRIAHEQLPIRQVGYSHCFRTEAGARGAEVRGLYRLHQFSKVELFAVAAPTQSEAMLEELLAASESLLQGLGLACEQARDGRARETAHPAILSHHPRPQGS
jgi:seryl-tRNA synthetase